MIPQTHAWTSCIGTTQKFLHNKLWSYHLLFSFVSVEGIAFCFYHQKSIKTALWHVHHVLYLDWWGTGSVESRRDVQHPSCLVWIQDTVHGGWPGSPSQRNNQVSILSPHPSPSEATNWCWTQQQPPTILSSYHG